jgi:hypothetical protein
VGRIVSGVCTACLVGCQRCSDSACITCSDSYLLFGSECLTTCPSGYRTNGFSCVATDTGGSGGGNSTTNSTTNSTITASNSRAQLVPLPWTILLCLIVIVVLLSKFQFQHTFVSATIVSLGCLTEVGSTATCLGLTLRDSNWVVNWSDYLFLLMVVSLGSNWALNLVLPCFQYYFIRMDDRFMAWFRARCSHRVAYNLINFIAFLLCFKIIWLPFSGLLHLFVFRALLSDDGALIFLRLMMVLSFLAVNAPAFVAGIILAYQRRNVDQMFFVYLDMTICNILTLIFGLLTFKMPEQHFENSAFYLAGADRDDDFMAEPSLLAKAGDERVKGDGQNITFVLQAHDDSNFELNHTKNVTHASE